MEFRKSNIANSGDGLFALTPFARGDIVTYYDGDLKQVAKVTGKQQIHFQEWTHWRSVPGYDLVIRGINRNSGAFDGRGGASLANHWPEKQNSAYKTRGHYIYMFCQDDFRWWRIPATLLVATRNISVGEEIYVDYGASSTAPQEIPFI